MRPRYILATAALTLLAGFAAGSLAHAGVPSAANSTMDSHIVWCPAGDDTFHVVVRDLAGNPQPSSYVVIDLFNCLVVAVCPLTGGETYSYDAVSRTVRTVADNQGRVALAVRAGGTCGAILSGVYADGVLLGTRSLTSPDQNGDQIVDAQDLALLQAKLGSADPSGDLDGNGIVSAPDLTILQQHSGHNCLGVTPAAPSSWGRVKTIYR